MAQEKRISGLLLGFYANRVRQLQRQIHELERASNELRTGEEQERIGVELEQARNELRTRRREFDRGRTELEQAGNEQRIGQEELENLELQRGQLDRDETSFEQLEETFLNQTRAIAQYSGQVDQFVENARQMRTNLVNQGEMLNQGFERGLRAQQYVFSCCCYWFKVAS